MPLDMDDSAYLKVLFSKHVKLVEFSAPDLAVPIGQAASLIFESVLGGHKLLACGDVGATVLAQHLCAVLLSHCERQRPALPGINLGDNIGAMLAIQQEMGEDDVFARQVRALGHSGDVVLTICNAPASPRILHAVRAAHDREIRVIGLGRTDDGGLTQALTRDDVLIPIPAESQARNIELNILILNGLCELIDRKLLGE